MDCLIGCVAGLKIDFDPGSFAFPCLNQSCKLARFAALVVVAFCSSLSHSFRVLETVYIWFAISFRYASCHGAIKYLSDIYCLFNSGVIILLFKKKAVLLHDSLTTTSSEPCLLAVFFIALLLVCVKNCLLGVWLAGQFSLCPPINMLI